MKTKSGFEYDFGGWATKNDLRCSDGRTIRKDAFAKDDGRIVPLVYMHQHNGIENVLGHALLENRDEGMYAYCSFNDTAPGRHGKAAVEHKDIVSLSIWANNLDERNGNVMHGSIKEVSIVLAGANPGAIIDFPYFAHSDEMDTTEAYICTGEPAEYADIASLSHADESEKKEEEAPKDGKKEGNGQRTVEDVLNTMNTEQRAVTDYLILNAIEQTEQSSKSEDGDEELSHSDNEGEDMNMKTNTFEAFGGAATLDPKTYLTHSEGIEIIKMAKETGLTLKNAIKMYAENNGKELMHANNDLGFKDINRLFPDYKLVKPGAPEMIEQDMGWVNKVINGTTKSPMSRLRTRMVDNRDLDSTPDGASLRPRGYTKGTTKQFRGNLDLIGRTTDPTTIYVLSKLNRDDIIDITDFSIVDYMYQMDRRDMHLETARQILIGDGRNGDGAAIDATKIRPIWTDDEFFCIHELVDVQSMRTTMNGSDSSKHFGDNYVYAEAILQSLLYSREKYKGSGNPTFFCHPHLVNVMLLARDLNGRRIYENVSDLKAALNVADIQTVEQFEGKTRQVTVTGENNTSTVQNRKLLGILVNMADYTVGATKGGELTHFTDFDLKFNQELSLLETRFSGSLLKPWSAIALEELSTGT